MTALAYGQTNGGRVAHVTSRLMEFFTQAELTMQLGQARELWPLAIIKELVDNGLDAAETAAIAPRIVVTISDHAISVADNGPGLPASVLASSLDYGVRVSDKNHYVAPTRGQLGNGLKCVWAAPFVWAGAEAQVEVHVGAALTTIGVTLDRIAQEPRVTRSEREAPFVRIGTEVTARWPEIASYLGLLEGRQMYNGIALAGLLDAYALFNPHARFELIWPRGARTWTAARPEWKKWTASDPTSPHWYTVERFGALITAFLRKSAADGKPITVREFISRFAGLSRSARQKEVCDATGLSGVSLNQVAPDGAIGDVIVAGLLDAMRQTSRAPLPAALGVLGEAHFRDSLVAYLAAAEGGFRYKRVEGLAGTQPFVVECAFAPKVEGYPGRSVRVGLNATPTLRSPIPELSSMLADARVASADPVAVAVHITSPLLEFTDRGKATLALGHSVLTALQTCVTAVTAPWKKAKHQADREDRLSGDALERLRREQRSERMNIKEASFLALPAAYAKVSDNGRLPANARQLMYAARPEVQRLTGGQLWANDAYFTQTLLPDFMDTHPDETANWDVLFDARGHLTEPHTDRRVALGTMDVRRYVGDWTTGRENSASGPPPRFEYPTCGPAARYSAVLFVEKEGFEELLRSARIAERFDVAIMSTKGMASVAARKLVDTISAAGVDVLVARDFDKAGFSIAQTLSSDTRRYQFRRPPRVHDLGLRLADADAMGLGRERCEYEGKVDPRNRLRECGATEEECDVLAQGQSLGGKWWGERIELNAMTSPQFIDWIERKLSEAGVGKVVPSAQVLTEAYRVAVREAAAAKAAALAVLRLPDELIDIPTDLEQRVTGLTIDSDRPWDDAIAELVAETPARSIGRRPRGNRGDAHRE